MSEPQPQQRNSLATPLALKFVFIRMDLNFKLSIQRTENRRIHILGLCSTFCNFLYVHVFI